MRLVLHYKDAKLQPPGETYPNPARRVSGHAPVRARPQHRSPAPALSPEAPVSSPGSRLRVRAHVGGQALQACGWAPPVREGSALRFVFDGLSDSGAWLFPQLFSDWGNGGRGVGVAVFREWDDLLWWNCLPSAQSKALGCEAVLCGMGKNIGGRLMIRPWLTM